MKLDEAAAILISVQPTPLAWIHKLQKKEEARTVTPELLEYMKKVTVYTYQSKSDNIYSKDERINDYRFLDGCITGKFTMDNTIKVCQSHLGILSMIEPGHVKRQRFDLMLSKMKLTDSQLFNYLNGRELHAWPINGFTMLFNPVELHYIKGIHAPQSYCYLNQEQVDEVERLSRLPF